MGQVVVVGAGPAGATAAYLLARNGIEVTLLERHLDFRREFRGEVLMPGGLEPLHAMGLRSELEALPQVRLLGFELYISGRLRVKTSFEDAGFGELGPRWISQPALLEMLVASAGRHASFRFERGAGMQDLLERDGRIAGVRMLQDGEERELHAALVIGADGRGSAVRRKAGLAAVRDPTPMDVVWCKVPRLPELAREPQVRGYVGGGHLLIAAPIHDGHTQVAWIIPKGSYSHVREKGIPACLDEMADHVSPDLAAHLRRHRDDALETFLLSTISDHVISWTRPGLVVIGDAAHTMSPVGAQGINIAIRDAVVLANRLVPVLRAGADPAAIDAACRAVQQEREPEVRPIQRLQALPPRVVLRDTWWSRLILSLVPALFAGNLVASRRSAVLRRFAFGSADVRPEV